MRLSAGILVPAALLLLVVASTASAQPVDGAVRGEVADVSGGVLPGVTVVAASADGRVVKATVTDAVGQYVLSGLPAGPLTLAFQLDGFDTSRVEVVVKPGAESVVSQRLRLAQITEKVVVVGKAPVEPPPPPPPYVPPPPPPRPAVIPVPAQELESVCGPAKAVMVPIVRRWNWKRNDFTTPAPLATIHSHRYDARRTLYTKGDELNIDAGTIKGLEVGRNLVVRRYFRANGNADTAAATGEHTAGLVQIVAAGEHSSTAVVVHACNELMKGDFLAAFNPEPVRTLEPAGTPAYEDAMRILFADDGQSLGVPRRLMVIDRRSEQALQAGQRLTLFRRSTAAAKPVILGEAIVIAVRTDSATIRVMSATDAIWSGDWAAPQRPSAAGSPVAKTSTHPQR